MNDIDSDPRQHDDIQQPEDASAPGPRGATGRKVILLVEDNEVDRDLYGSLLWYNGYDVTHVEDGPSAVDRALEIGPDLILLDIRLPGDMDGLDVARMLRDRGVTIPIIALSAYSRDELGDRLDDAGVDAFLEKPVDPLAVVREAMRRIGRDRAADAE